MGLKKKKKTKKYEFSMCNGDPLNANSLVEIERKYMNANYLIQNRQNLH